MATSKEPTITLTFTTDEARHIAPALRAWARQVCDREFGCSSDPFGALTDAARTYSTLMTVSRKLGNFCAEYQVEQLNWDGHRYP